MLVLMRQIGHQADVAVSQVRVHLTSSGLRSFLPGPQREGGNDSDAADPIPIPRDVGPAWVIIPLSNDASLAERKSQPAMPGRGAEHR